MNGRGRHILLEAELAGELLGTGVTAISKAKSHNKGTYYRQFFELSNGLERLCKLFFVLERMDEDYYSKIAQSELKAFGHDIFELFENVSRRITERSLSKYSKPDNEIHRSILECLSLFAKRTRYYNLNYFDTGSSKVGVNEPMQNWYLKVILPIQNQHISAKTRKKDALKNQELRAAMDSVSSVHHTDEMGFTLRKSSDVHKHEFLNEKAAPFVRLYVMQIIRWLCSGVISLQKSIETKQVRNGIQELPDLLEVFGNFLNDDVYFKSRKTWSIYNS